MFLQYYDGLLLISPKIYFNQTIREIRIEFALEYCNSSRDYHIIEFHVEKHISMRWLDITSEVLFVYIIKPSLVQV